jgi:hypothetical protein
MKSKIKKKPAKILTVSQVKFTQTVELHKCPYCGRIRPLGRVPGDSGPAKCIDCTFGPPMHFWIHCKICGSLEVNPETYCWSCDQDKKRHLQAFKGAGKDALGSFHPKTKLEV